MRGVYCVYIINPEDIPTWNIFGIGISLYFIFYFTAILMV